ncbi:MAG TPA: ParB/RepB/Spo0J family partition protein [Steroidobacteraceae bacterium]
MSQIVSVRPFRCRVWNEHERSQEYLSEETCRTEIESFHSHGQLVPALGRPLYDDPEHDVEIVCGTRRLFVARHLNVLLKVELRALSDREAAVALDIENRQRRNVSAYERGCSYQSWLRANYFSSQDELAKALSVSPAQVSRLMKMAQIPPVIINAFENPADICESWGAQLYNVWRSPERRRLVVRRARALSRQSLRPPAEKVFQELVSGPNRARRGGKKIRDEVVCDARGAPMFRIRYRRRIIAVILPTETVSPGRIQDVKSLLADYLQRKSVTVESLEQAPKPQMRGRDLDVCRGQPAS